MFIPYRKIKEHYNVSPQTLRNWALQGSIDYKIIKRDTRSTWLYDLESVGKQFQGSEGFPDTTPPIIRRILYARVSSQKQRDDLTRQINLLQTGYPDGEVISDIGSGINYKRPGFTRLVDWICRKEISEVVVTYKDRLLRFGFELFEQICKENNVRIRIYGNENSANPHSETELQEDLLAIINVFVAKNNGLRSGQLKKIRKQQKTEKEEIKDE